jgi:hypothetical protein
MTTAVKKASFRVRRGIQSDWDSIDPILKDGQFGWDKTTGRSSSAPGSAGVKRPLCSAAAPAAPCNPVR